MKRSVFLGLGALLLLTNSVTAGWYKVENFEGSIGGEPVHVSLQMYEFGSGLTVKGSYYFDAQRVPIAIYGTNNGPTLELCEIESSEQFQEVMILGSAIPMDTSACPLSLELDEAGAKGERTDGKEWKEIVLTRVARLDDTGTAKVEGIVDIAFWHQTDKHLLVGRYAKAGERACMDVLQLVNKVSGSVDQEIGFDTEQCDAGTVMTPIYMNVEGYTDQSSEVVYVNVQDGGAGTTVDYDVDAKTGLLSVK